MSCAGYPSPHPEEENALHEKDGAYLTAMAQTGGGREACLAQRELERRNARHMGIAAHSPTYFNRSKPVPIPHKLTWGDNPIGGGTIGHLPNTATDILYGRSYEDSQRMGPVSGIMPGEWDEIPDDQGTPMIHGHRGIDERNVAHSDLLPPMRDPLSVETLGLRSKASAGIKLAVLIAVLAAAYMYYRRLNP